jgi:hypothetical protein
LNVDQTDTRWFDGLQLAWDWFRSENVKIKFKVLFG